MKTKVLVAAGIASMIAAIFVAIKTAKEEVKEEAEETVNEEPEAENEKKTFNEKAVKFIVKAAKKVKRYWITVAFTAFAIFCFMFTLKISYKQTAVAVAAAKAAQEALNQYKEAAKEVVGETKERFISNKAAEIKADKDKVDEKPVIEPYPADKDGLSLFYDPYSESLFMYPRAGMDMVQDELNALMKDNGWICIQDFYNVAKLDQYLYFDKALDLGVNEIDGPVRLGLEPIVLKKGKHAGEVAFVITMNVMPYEDYID